MGGVYGGGGGVSMGGVYGGKCPWEACMGGWSVHGRRVWGGGVSMGGVAAISVTCSLHLVSPRQTAPKTCLCMYIYVGVKDQVLRRR